jgi:hypothetical protein
MKGVGTEKAKTVQTKAIEENPKQKDKISVCV